MEKEGNIQLNTGRQFELDFAKFVAIIFMILVHCYDYSPLYVSTDAIPSGHTTSTLGTIIEFLGAQPAAPVFMFCMGIGLVYTRHDTPEEFARRGLKLFITGYLLNLYRTMFVVGGSLFGALGDNSLSSIVAAFALCVDILPFAGLSFLFFALMKHLKVSLWNVTIIVLVLLIIANMLPVVGGGEQWYCYIAGLLWYQNSFTSFPLMQWLPFPMMGVLFGRLLKDTTNKDRFYLYTLLAGVITFILTTSITLLRGIDLRTFFMSDYFNMNILSVAWSLSIVLTLLSVYYFMVKNLGDCMLRQIATFCSRNINKIYLWQWIIITPLSVLSFTVLPVDTYWKLFIEVALVFFACISRHLFCKTT